jgi:glyoxylase-like metal-dependent hydrolase (beta-lactamase superfamily II)
VFLPFLTPAARAAAISVLRVLALPLLALLAVAPATAQEFVLQPRQVGPHSWAVFGEAGMATAANRGFNSNAGFVVTRAGVVVFDTLGTPALGEALIAAIRRVTPQPIRRVVISHYHADHYYGAQAFKAIGAEIWAHEAGRGVVGSDEANARLEQRRQDLFPWVDEKTRPADADRWLAFGERGTIDFEFGGLRFRLLDVGGAHSPQDLMMFVADDGVLFAGDLFFTGRIPFVVGANTRRWLQAMDRIAEVNPRVAVPGHGDASQRVMPDLLLTRDYLRDLREKMGQAVEAMDDFEAAYDRIDWSRWERLPAFLPGNRLNARSVYLEMERESLRR